MNNYQITDTIDGEVARVVKVSATDREHAQEIYLDGVDASGEATGELLIVRV